ncbi:MAG TPA: extracellular solute-binding protein [Termitinemataceae bacterium]|nr:extracellular solute-binding protein [Termitinemataceae bacterium]HOM23131.1 extracellular solute-binding protein [Termitinemataceae bacterium]HPQ00346.1 extracellular solute-binding protein [Termitinemataceae bacterium]
MKKTWVIISCLLLIAGNLMAQSKAVWRGNQYQIEKGAKIRLGVDNDKLGEALVNLWNTVHPEAKGVVEYMNFGAAGGADQITALQGEAPDVALVIDGEVGRNFQSLLQLDKVITDGAAKFAQEPFYSGANAGAVIKYVPIAYDGMAFAWNKTMMEALKLDTSDKNKDGLPDAFDTWEEIFDLAKKWQTSRPTYKGKPVTIVYPMCLDEVWSGYSNLTAGKFRIFPDKKAENPSFETPEFLAGLEFIKAAADAMISVEANGVKTPGASMVWRWDDALNNETAPFFLVGTWMDVNGAETKGGYDIKFGPMPTWKGNRLSPFVKTKGFVINGFTKYPSAAHELYRLLYTKEGLQTLVNNSAYIPALKKGAPNTPNYRNDPNKAEMSVAFAFNYPEPTLTLPKNPAKKAMDGYYGIGLNLELRAVWDGEKTPAQAQATIVDLYKKWYAENNK